MMTKICQICGESNWSQVYSKSVIHPLWSVTGQESKFQLNYYCCHECGFIVLNPVLSLEQYQQYYESSSAPSHASFGKRAPMLVQRRAFLLRHLESASLGRVIEVGPAYGDFLLTLNGAKDLIGIEPSRKYCDFVKAEHPELSYYPFMLENLSDNAPELIGTADLVISCNVLEHTMDPRAFVQALTGVIRQDGLVLLEVPGVEAMAECPAPRYQTLHPGHVCQFSAATLNRLCASLGLQLVALESTAMLDYPVLRVLFRKAANGEQIAELFRRHCDAVDTQAQIAKRIMLENLAKARGPVIWGCGQDLLDIVNLCSDAEHARLIEQVTVVDVNKMKHGKEFFQAIVVSPDDVCKEVDLVLIPSRSELLRDDIRAAAHARFPRAHVVYCYN